MKESFFGYPARARAFALFSFLGARFRGNQPGYPIVDHELTVVFSVVLDQAIGQISQPVLLMGVGVGNKFRHALVPFGFYRGGAVSKGLFDEGDHIGFGLVMVALGVFFGGRLLAQGEIGEVVVGVGGVQKRLGKAALGRSRFEIVLVLGKIFGHHDQFF